MTPRSLFTIILKIIGIYLVFESILVIPQLSSSLSLYLDPYGEDNSSMILFGIALLIPVLGIYFLILRYCLFKTEWIIDKLALDKHFTEEKFELNIHRSTVLSIAVIVIGCLMFVDSFPKLCIKIYNYIGQKQDFDRFGENSAGGWVIFEAAKTFIAYFLMTNSRLVVNFIERKRKNV